MPLFLIQAKYEITELVEAPSREAAGAYAVRALREVKAKDFQLHVDDVAKDGLVTEINSDGDVL